MTPLSMVYPRARTERLMLQSMKTGNEALYETVSKKTIVFATVWSWKNLGWGILTSYLISD